MSIKVLCFSCQTLLFTTTVEELDWPLKAEMFQVKYPGFYLRPGYLDLEYFCPACSQYPFSYDPYTPGGKAVGKNLCIRGKDGKPVVMTIKQMLMESGTPELPMPAEPLKAAPLPVADIIRASKPASCSQCGAKPGRGGFVAFHKKGCPLTEFLTTLTVNTDVCPECGYNLNIHATDCKWSSGKLCPFCEEDWNSHKSNCPFRIQIDKTLDDIVKQQKAKMKYGKSPVEQVSKEVAELEQSRQQREASVSTDPHFAAIEARVKSGPDREDTPPTPGELAEIERGRETRREKPEPKLRPGEGYAPKVRVK